MRGVCSGHRSRWPRSSLRWSATIRRSSLAKRNGHYAKTYQQKRREKYDKPLEIPPQVIEQKRHRVMLRHTEITALLMNDPLPGESALDRRPVKAPSIVHDVLDDLIFAG